jgi:hypothetical protein
MAIADLERRSPFEAIAASGSTRQAVVVQYLAIASVLGYSAYHIYAELGGFQSDLMVFLLVFFVLLVIVNPIYGVVGMIAAIGFSPDSVGYNNVRLTDYMIPPMLIICWFKMKSGPQRISSPDIARNIKIYLAICVFATVKGVLLATVWTWLGAVQFFFKYVEYFLLMWLAMQLVDKKEDLVFVLIGSFLVCSSVAYLAYTSRQAVIDKYDYQFVRAGGPQGETPNVLGGYYLIHIMLAFALVFSVKNYIYKLMLGAFLMAVALPLLYTYSRTSFASVVIGLLVTCLFIDLRYIFIILLIVFLNQLFLPQLNNINVEESFVDRYSTIFELFGDDDDKPSSWTARTTGWYVSYLKTWKSDPFFGRGIGSVGLGVDSSYVKKFTETGMLGLMSFIMLLIRLGRLGTELIRLTTDRLYRGVGIGYLGILVGICVHAIGVSSFSTIRTAEPFFFFSGLMVGLHSRMLMRREEVAEDELEERELKFNARS